MELVAKATTMPGPMTAKSCPAPMAAVSICGTHAERAAKDANTIALNAPENRPARAAPDRCDRSQDNCQAAPATADTARMPAMIAKMGQSADQLAKSERAVVKYSNAAATAATQPKPTANPPSNARMPKVGFSRSFDDCRSNGCRSAASGEY
jgi:hypothetical protein